MNEQTYNQIKQNQVAPDYDRDEHINIFVSRAIADEPVYYRTDVNTKLRILPGIAVRDLFVTALDSEMEEGDSGMKCADLCQKVWTLSKGIGNTNNVYDLIVDELTRKVSENFEAILEYERELAQ